MLDGFAFDTTADLAPLTGLLAQPRARDAIAFGTAIADAGFNIFVTGATGAGMLEAVRAALGEAARARPAPRDWIYVHNYAEPHRPKAIPLPPRRAPGLRRAVRTLIDDLRISLKAVFESEDYQQRRNDIEQSIRVKNERAFSTLSQKAMERNVAILRTPMGFGMAPVRDGKVVQPAEFKEWPEAEQRNVRDAIEQLEKELEQTMRCFPRLEKEQREAVRELDRETAAMTIAPLFDELKVHFANLPDVLGHIETMRADVLENIQAFIAAATAEPASVEATARLATSFDRYDVNVLVSQAEHGEGAPVVEELHPTLGNLFGRVEHLQVQGALVTDFRLIRAGSLHRANGGAILMDARHLLAEPFSWTALKRALQRRQLTIEDLARFIGLTTTVSLEPEPIPLDLKVVLVGDRMLYYLLASLDPEFSRHFKILADFDDEMERSPAGEQAMARLVGTIAREQGLRPLDRGGVGRLIEHAARLAENTAKLTLVVERLRDLMAEANFLAGQAERAVVTRADVEGAVAEQVRRASRIQERSQEMMLRNIALVETEGSKVGQVNGLSVIALGDHAFGRPSRITCRVRPGAGKIVDIEREVELGGPLHSKGVLILSGYLAGRYALDVPMSLYASLVFEQSYGGVEGDSASSAELYALLSALAEAPLRQDLAVTGSVNQHGEVQAIGGVNEKIEGFFDLCATRGLSGRQGVLIPAANVQHLMLRADVVEACAVSRFAIYAVRNIDEGIALLTGLDAGERDGAGAWPPGSVNARVEERMKRFAEARRRGEAGREGEGRT
jgi:lon-related putative ATP-dependent protease